MKNKPTPTTTRILRLWAKANHRFTVHSNRFPKRGREAIHTLGKEAGVLTPAAR